MEKEFAVAVGIAEAIFAAQIADAPCLQEPARAPSAASVQQHERERAVHPSIFVNELLLVELNFKINWIVQRHC